MTDRTQTHATFVLEREYPVPVERVWTAFADPEIKQQWFGSDDFVYVERSDDFRVGGLVIDDARHGEDGPLSQFRATYTDIVPNERIVYSYDMWLDGAPRLDVDHHDHVRADRCGDPAHVHRAGRPSRRGARARAGCRRRPRVRHFRSARRDRQAAGRPRLMIMINTGIDR
ncbi:hypothetical protein GCM10028864_27250 [Microlunatus parietis]